MPTLATDSYVTEAEYQAYADVRGITVSAVTINYDLVLSADFINRQYNLLDEYKLPGIEATELAAIKTAALMAVQLQQAGRMTIDYAAIAVGVVKRTKKKADVLEKEIEYQDGTTPTIKPRVPELDQLIRPFLAGGSFGKRLV